MNGARRWIWLAAAMIVAAFALRLPLLSVPLERDEGGYAYMADRMHQGDTLYLDLVETKPPGVFCAYWLLLAGGRSVPYLRLMFALTATLTAVLFALFAVRKFGVRAGALSAALLAPTMAAPAYFGFSGNAEMFMVPLTVGALWLLSRREEGAWATDLLGGVLFALAALTKPVALAEGLAVATLILLRPTTNRRRLLGLVLAGLGLVATEGIVLALFAWKGTVVDYLYWAYGYNLDYTTALSTLDRLRAFVYQVLKRGMLVRDWPLAALGIGGIIALARRRERWTDLTFVLLWLIGAGIGTAASGRFTPHYFIQLLPPLCLAAGIGLDRLLSRLEAAKASPVLRQGLVVVLLLLALVYPTLTQAKLFAAGPQLSRILYGLNPFMEGEEIGRYLREHTWPEESIFIAGTEGQFLYHAQRKSATKFVFTYPLGTTHRRAWQWQQDVLREVERNRPRYIVIVRLGSSMILEKDAPKLLLEKLETIVGSEDFVREAALIATSPTETRLVTGDIPPQAPVILDLYRRRD
ncbi:MAG TPA: hypothetical protein PKW95_05990 [bacterium]|nr:hypothetical protein [bacterium]